MSEVQEYRSTEEPEAFVAVVGSRELPVRATRLRAYPGLAGPAPSTLGVYRAFARSLAGRHAVLDAGCGAGAGSRILVAPGRGVTGLDVSDEACAFARSYASNVELVRGSPDDLDASARFDAAVVADVLGLLSAPTAFVRALRARLPADGLLLVAECRASLGQHLGPPARTAYTQESLEAALIRGGFLPDVALASPAEFVALSARPAADAASADALAQAESPGALHADRVSDVMAAVERALDRAVHPAEARELLLAYGALHLSREDWDSAAGTFVGALKVHATCARAQVGLGQVAERVRRPGDALRLYEKATRTDPLAPSGWAALGALRATNGDTQGAREALGNALILAPADEASARSLARLGDAGTADDALPRVAEYARPTAW